MALSGKTIAFSLNVNLVSLLKFMSGGNILIPNFFISFRYSFVFSSLPITLDKRFA